MRDIFLVSLIICFVKFLNSYEWGTNTTRRGIKNSIAVSKFRSVFNHSYSVIFCITLLSVNRNTLEFPPSHWESYWVFSFQNMWIPSMFFNSNPNICKSSFLMLKTAHYNWILRLKLSREFLFHSNFNLYICTNLIMTVLFS